VLLWSSNSGVPGDAVTLVDVPGWADPFGALALVDAACLVRDADPEGTPFALQLPTDDGLTRVFHGNQETVTLDGVDYELSVNAAAAYTHPTMKGPTSELVYSVVRH
jgi:hypothetical protein